MDDAPRGDIDVFACRGDTYVNRLLLTAGDVILLIGFGRTGSVSFTAIGTLFTGSFVTVLSSSLDEDSVGMIAVENKSREERCWICCRQSAK